MIFKIIRNIFDFDKENLILIMEDIENQQDNNYIPTGDTKTGNEVTDHFG